MSNGLDFQIGTPEGLYFRYIVSMEASFGSNVVGEEIDSGRFPILHGVWGYHSTPVPRGQLPAMRIEVINLIKAVSPKVSQRVIDELDDLLVFLKQLEDLGLGVHVSGP